MSTETGYCEFPLCSRIVERNGFCFLHAPHFAGPKPEKVKKPLKKQSKKEAKIHRQYVKIVKAAAEEDNSCKVNSPVCIGIMQGFNHIQKRSPKNKMVLKNLTDCCIPCNGYIETHKDWAAANGHFISRFQKAV